MGPALPVPLVEDDEVEAPSVWWLAASAPASPIMPGLIDAPEAVGVSATKLAHTAPPQPVPLATIAESSSAWALKMSSSAKCAPQLPDELDPERRVSPKSGATWSVHRRAPLYPEALLPDPDAVRRGSDEPAVSRPSEPIGTSPRQDLESHFSMLKSDRPAYPIDLTDGPNSDESGLSSPTVRGGDGVARTGTGKSDKRQKRDGEAKSSQASQRSKGLSSWPGDDQGNDVQ